MGLNVSKGNMYNFIDYTWNTIKGKCPHGCSYCYMKRWKNLPHTHFDEKELKTDLGTGNYIFVGSSCDMFADVIPDGWILKTLGHCMSFDNKYLFQTKNPGRILEFINFFSFNKIKAVFCTTIESCWFDSSMGNSPSPYNRAIHMNQISRLGFDTMVTIEPIMIFGLTYMTELIKLCNPIMVNIGADSGRNNLLEPSKEEVLALISELEKFTNVHQKKNLQRLLK